MRVPGLSPRLIVGLLAVASVIAAPSGAQAFSPFLVVPEPAVAEASPAYRYANMTDMEALAELERRRVPFVKVGRADGVRAPIRLAGKLHGVEVRSSLPPEQRATSPFEILDARLALSLDDLCALLERHDIDELVHFTMYRPSGGARGPLDERARPQAKGPQPLRTPAGAPRKLRRRGPAKSTVGGHKAPAGKKHLPASRAKKKLARSDMRPTRRAPPGTRHPAGLAIDVAMLHKRDGRWLNVAQDFHGRIGQRTCGAGAPVPDGSEAKELRALVCEAAGQGIFTYVLTPDYDAAHADHLHMEIKPGVKWFLYH